MKLQQAIQERLSKVEKIKLSVDRSGENPKEAFAQNKELIRQLEEEISELQSENVELELLSQTEDNLRFLQVCVIVHTSVISHTNLLFSAQQPLILKYSLFLVRTEISIRCNILMIGRTC